MKLLVINKMYYPDIGGVETVVRQYSEFVSDDFSVTVLCVSKRYTKKTYKEVINNVEVIRCSSLGVYFSMPLSISFVFYYFILVSKFDIVHFHEPFPMASVLGCLYRPKKYIITWHSDIIKQKILRAPFVFFQKYLCSNANVITTTSPNLAKSSSVLRFYQEKTKIFPLSISVKNYSIDSDRIGHGLEDGYILSLGRLSYYKGIEVLLASYERALTNRRLVIVGDGDPDLVDYVYEFVSKSDKDILFVNSFVTENEKMNYLSDCAFFVFPSTYPSEAFGIMQLEAMIYNKPVINTLLPTGVPFVSLDNVTGITVKPNDIIGLSKAIDDLSHDYSKRLLLGGNARKRVEQLFSDNVVLPKIKEIYLSL